MRREEGHVDLSLSDLPIVLRVVAQAGCANGQADLSVTPTPSPGKMIVAYDLD